MTERVTVTKTYKLFINGAFPRTESGRSLPVHDAKGEVIAHFCSGSPKDLRDAVEAARAAQEKWAARTGYNRGQILHRLAEMLEGRREELIAAIGTTGGATNAAAGREVDDAIDRLICFAGWADKYAQVLGCQNPVAGPYYNFTVPEPSGVVGVVAPDVPSLLGLITLIAPPLCAGNTIIALAGIKHPLPAALLGEICATSDVPAGVVNIITGKRGDLIEHLAKHRDIDAISAANLPKSQATTLRRGAADNVKRVHVQQIKPQQWRDESVCQSPWTIEPLVEMKTTWHPSAT